MNAKGEARDALVHLQGVVRTRWTPGGDSHVVLCVGQKNSGQVRDG